MVGRILRWPPSFPNPWWRCSPLECGQGNDNPLQHSCLENPMDRGTWQATVHRVAQMLDKTKLLNNRTRYDGFHPMSSLHDTSEEILQKVKSQMGWLWVNQRRDCCGWLRLKEGVFKRLLEKKVGVWVILSLVLRTCGCHVVSGPVDGPRWLRPDRKPSLGRNREASMHPHGNELHHNPWVGKMVWASDKNERKTNAIHWRIHMESRKMVLMNLLAGQHWRYRHRERILWMQRGRRGWEELREYHWNKYITVHKIDSRWEFAVWYRKLTQPSALWHPRGVGWDGRLGGSSRGRHLWLIHAGV